MEAAASFDFCTVFSESKRIIGAHSRHFLALSVIFLLPLSFSLTVYPTLHNLLLPDSRPPDSQALLRHVNGSPEEHPDFPTGTILFSLGYSAFVLLLSLCAVASITYSVFHGFYGRPVKLPAAIKSIFVSFIPLSATIVVSQAIVSLIFVAFGLVLFVAIRVMEALGYHFDFNSPYSIAVTAVVAVVLFLVLLTFQVNWTLASVVSVVESSWGFQPLRRSAHLIQGMRWVALALFLFFGFFSGVLIYISSLSAVGSDGASRGWKSWVFVVQIVVTSTLLVLILLYNAAANTVLYLYCKAIHGELAFEIAEEFAREYVSLPFDNGKVPYVVSVAYT